MKKIMIIFCLIFLMVSCNNSQLKNKKILKFPLRKGKNWEEIFNLNSDIPNFHEFSYSWRENSIYASIFDVSNIRHFYLKINLNNKKFFLFGKPGQCPDCTLYVNSVSVLDNLVVVGMQNRGYNFYDFNGDFLFQFSNPDYPSGPCFIIEDKFYALPCDTMDFKDKLLYVFDLKSMKLIGKYIDKKVFLSRIGYYDINNFGKNKGKNNISSVTKYITVFKYCIAGKENIAVLPCSLISAGGNKKIYFISLKNFSIKELSLKKYCNNLISHFHLKKFEVFSDVGSLGKNIFIARRLIKGYDDKLIEKYGYLLLLEINVKGELKSIYKFPKELYPAMCSGVFPWCVRYVQNNEFLINMVFGLKNGSNYKAFLKTKGIKLTKKEENWVLGKL